MKKLTGCKSDSISINTDRLTMRPMTDDEWKLFVDRVFEADECLFQFGCEKCDGLREMVAEPNSAEVIYYSVFADCTDEMIGYVGLSPKDNNLEFYIFEDFRRMGYAYDALEAFIDSWALGKIIGTPHNEFYAKVIDDNFPCIKLLEKLGFKKSGWGMNITSDYGFYRFEYVA